MDRDSIHTYLWLRKYLANISVCAMRVPIILLVFCEIFSCQHIRWKIREPVDLTWPVDENSISWPGVSSFIYTKKVAKYDENEMWLALNEFCTGEHSGTHLDAPYHFYKYGWKVADIPIQRLFARGVVVDMSDVVKRLGPNVELQARDLIDWERIYGPMPPHCVVLVRFGWAEYYPSKDKYLGQNDTDLAFPGIAADAAQWLVKSGKIVGVGVDTASVDSGSSTTFAAHRIMAANNIYNMENVNILKELPARGFSLIIMPMKLKDGSGAPLRVVAVPDITFTPDPECPPTTYSVNSVPWYGHTSVILSSLLLLGMYTINCFTL